MESSGKMTLICTAAALIVSSCSSVGPLAMLEITPLPKEVVAAVKVEYEPVYAVMRVLEVSEKNGVQKNLVARLGDSKDGISKDSMGEIAADSSFGEVIGTFKVTEISGSFIRCSIETVTHKVPANAYIRIQTGQKEKDIDAKDVK